MGKGLAQFAGLAGVGVILLLLWYFRSFFLGDGSSPAGEAQSWKNALSGFPNGSDPGTVPAAQYAQGVAESVRNFSDYVFGNPEDQIDPSSEIQMLAPGGYDPQAYQIALADPNAQAWLAQMATMTPPDLSGPSIENWLSQNRVF